MSVEKNRWKAVTLLHCYITSTLFVGKPRFKAMSTTNVCQIYDFRPRVNKEIINDHRKRLLVWMNS